MTTTSDKAHRIASMIYKVDRELPGNIRGILDNYHDVLTHMNTYVEVSKDRDDYPRLVELERELSILLGEPKPPYRDAGPWEMDEAAKFLAGLIDTQANYGPHFPCNIRTVDTDEDRDAFDIHRVERDGQVVHFIARDHLGEDVKFRIKVERS